MKQGIVNGIFVILIIVVTYIACYLVTGSMMDGGISGLLLLLAILASGFWFKRKYKASISIFNKSSKKIFSHALGMAIVFVAAMLLSGMLNDIFNLGEYGLIIGIILLPIIVGAQWANILGLMIVGGFFYKIKDKPNPLSAKLVAVASFDDSVLAQMAQDVLVDNEIPVCLQNEFTSSIWANSLERIRIQVPPEFKKEAEDILKEIIPVTES